jgi:16S rRNA (guanine966-N2)-methyltransferase
MRIISGEFKGQRIATTKGPGYRPATDKVREALFSMLESRGIVWFRTSVLDLFAGSGSLGFEALSRGAAQVWMVERDRRAVAKIKETMSLLRVDSSRCRPIGLDVDRFLRRQSQSAFDLVFIDPPYRRGLLAPTLEALAAGGFLASGALCVAEVEANLNLIGGVPEALILDSDRRYGQTRIYIWQTAKRCTPAPSTP